MSGDLFTVRFSCSPDHPFGGSSSWYEFYIAAKDSNDALMTAISELKEHAGSFEYDSVSVKSVCSISQIKETP